MEKLEQKETKEAKAKKPKKEVEEQPKEIDNLSIYNKVREVPKEAQKTITGGRINGLTNINPMWRIKALTETFGVVGIGWYYNITEKRLETTAGGETVCFVQIELFVKVGKEWSMPIVGVGGSMFVSKEKAGFRVSDEAEKMALTDAISVACKALGIGADIYWNNDPTKYDESVQKEGNKKGVIVKEIPLSNIEIDIIIGIENLDTKEELNNYWKANKDHFADPNVLFKKLDERNKFIENKES